MTKQEEERFNAAVAGFTPCGHVDKDTFLSSVFAQAWNAVSLAMVAITDRLEFRIPVKVRDLQLPSSAPACYTYDLPSEEEIRELFMKHFHANQWRWERGKVWIDVTLTEREDGKFTLVLVFCSVSKK